MFASVRFVSANRTPDALVLAHFKGQGLDRDSAKLDPSGAAADALKRPEATGDLGRIVEAFPTKSRGGPKRILIVGLGEKDKFEPGRLRDAAGAIGRRLATTKDARAQIEVHYAVRTTKADFARCGQCFGEGLGLIGWTCDEFKGTASKNNDRKPLAVSAPGSFGAGIERGLGLAESANFARTVSHTPPNICTPSWVAAEARRLAKKVGLRCTVFSGPDLERHDLIGLINVGKGSANKPCMVRLEYKPRGGGRGRPAVLIGKTMTYDSGGLSLKINNTMRGMKRDKDGGCAVLGAMHAVATVIKPRRPVVALLVVAENSVSDDAYRPDDIIKYRNGVSVEVTNTDAEGRLVLADGLCWACEKEDPAFIVDLATLTGGVVVALGNTYAGMWCEDDALRRRIEAASAASGERAWRLPHHEEYREMMKSDIADIINSNPDRKAHPIQGEAFLSYFVKDGVPWCHLDIAGVHLAESDKGPFVKNAATGWGVRLLAELLDAE